ncbi:MAG TPA: hypothetical protein PK514_10135 [Spirochaetota bacterium]|nr:hypothetical protein [Spirochaetota bacterium]
MKNHHFYKGFTAAAAGVTSGMVDVKLIYAQDFRDGYEYKRSIYLTGIEFTIHFPLQRKFIRENPLIELFFSSSRFIKNVLHKILANGITS